MKHPWSGPLAAVTLLLAACAPVADPATPAPATDIDLVGTAVSATLTAMPLAATVAPDAPSPPPTQTPLPPPVGPACALAYADGGRLFCLDVDGAAVQLAEVHGGEIIDLKLSSDGTRVAYRIGAPGAASQLMVVNADGTGERQLAGAEQLPSRDPGLVDSPFRFEWVPGTHVLIFDTSFLSLEIELGPGEYINADLWWADADTGELRQLKTDGQAGLFDVSPNGNWIAISRAEGLDLISADGSLERPGLVSFPFIITYSEYAYKPAIAWSPDSAFFSAVVPSEDPLSPEASAALYRVPADGDAQRLNALPGNFVFDGEAHFAPDGARLFYTLFVSADGGFTARVFNVDGSGALTLGQGAASATFLGWAPDSTRYAYALDGQAFAGSLDGAAPVPLGAAQISRLSWVDGLAFYWHGALDGQWGVWYQSVAGVQVLAAETSERAIFDVRP